ncbi:MAG: phosphoribosylformylglycinamidine synthase [Firmicutes bacterium HGW-Firmicutes-19]|nr:MAG: phosphoribosylformylglycinamidine synthase [Firmicutes bacterium HGW-Firmicutes-19]
MKFRLFVQKRNDIDSNSASLSDSVRQQLMIDAQVTVFNGYDIDDLDESYWDVAIARVFSEPMTDMVYLRLPKVEGTVIVREPLPGQYDQRADSAQQCLRLIDVDTLATVKTFEVAMFDTELSDEECLSFIRYWINPIETRQKDLDLDVEIEDTVSDEGEIHGFTAFNDDQLKEFLVDQQAAMSFEDIKLIQRFFTENENRNPTRTEFKVLDTYWSDHCRHTTFETVLDEIIIEEGPLSLSVQKALNFYQNLRIYTERENRPDTLMEIATIYAKALNDARVEISDEINACSVKINIDTENGDEEWLLQFKNETHNHPTEIEPYGGASTCIGGAIRDPLSGRAYVYQAMRISGCGNIKEEISETMPDKLPQRVIALKATAGNSGYGNQVGVATTTVKEIYHPRYVAKHLELGAVVGVVKADHVRRLKPVAGDVIVLVGGKTGRDGIGGATGSSIEHDSSSLLTCAAQVQKGNAVEERKIQRLFRNPDVSLLIKKCNDFGAGGVSVAIGELADGLTIDLSAVPTKYMGLNATELAISESQERMAVVLDPNDVDKFLDFARQENLEATVVAKVTESKRLIMKYQDSVVVDLDRALIDTHGVRQHAKARIVADYTPSQRDTFDKDWALSHISSLNVCSQKGLIERFDSTINALSVLAPLGGKYQLTPSEGSVSKIPVLKGNTSVASILTYGFNPQLSEQNMFVSAQGAVLESIAKVLALGGQVNDIFFSFQEYFPKLKNHHQWGEVTAALLGALSVQKTFGRPAIGGKDSMSGSFKQLDVLPTLVSFACATTTVKNVISSEAKHKGNRLYMIQVNRLSDGSFDLKDAKHKYIDFENMCRRGSIISASVVKESLFASIVVMLMGNGLGITVDTQLSLSDNYVGSLLVESNDPQPDWIEVGIINDDYTFNGIMFDKDEIKRAYVGGLEFLYPIQHTGEDIDVTLPSIGYPIDTYPFDAVDEVHVVIPVFPGTNCEVDTALAFEKASGIVDFSLIRNLNKEDLNESIEQFVSLLDHAHILALPGGFSMGDEPDGSAKFIVNILKNEKVKAAVERLLSRKGLIIGICNGFQALIKSGLLPYGKIMDLTFEDATLTFNSIGRHISTIATTRLVCDGSPWLKDVGEEVIKVPFSHGEGRLMASEQLVQRWIEYGQIAFQMCDDEGRSTMDPKVNLNGSVMAIEGLISPCGQILGKMGHTERIEMELYKNIPGIREIPLFENGINYFKKR